MSISNAILECVRTLTPTQTDKTLSPNLRQELADIVVRLKIWAGNIGVFAPDNASVDYRLRDDPELVEVVLSMTRKLKHSLLKAIHPPLLEESDVEDEEVHQGRTEDPVSSGSSSASLDLDSSVEYSDTDDDPGRLGPSAILIEEANNIINRLYRLVTVFRKPASSSQNAKIRDYMKKLNEKGDIEELEDIEDHARCHIEVHCPKAPEFLVSRLVEAVTFRRMKIRYRQRHQAKLSQGLELLFSEPAQSAPYDKDTETPTAETTLPTTLSSKRDTARVPSGPHPKSRSVAFSATVASSINRARFADYAKSTALSGITKAAVGRRQQLEVPAPPKEDGQDKLECPYCLRMVSREEMAQPRWTRHILRDIDPLNCLFKDCEESLTLFKTVEEWLGHMQWQHTIVYCCQAVGHEREILGSSQDLEDHIRGEHPGTFTETQLPSLLKQGAVPASNTLGTLNLSLGLDESQCLLCHNFEPPEVVAEALGDAALTPSQLMQNHILEHLESIALIALPDSGGADTVDSDARQLSHDADAEDKMETDDIFSAEFEDITAERARDESVPDQDGHDELWAAVLRQSKQSHLLEPHEDPILIGLEEGRRERKTHQVAAGDVGSTEEVDFKEIDLPGTEADSDAEDGKHGEALQNASNSGHELSDFSFMNNVTPSKEKADMPERVFAAQKASVPETQSRSLPNMEVLVKNLGIKVRFQPQHDYEIEIDILAVPGIGTDPETTWTYISRGPWDNSKVTREVNWLSDPTMLPQKFPNARIMTFGYDSFWFGVSPVRNTLSGIATSLLLGLGRFRKGCGRRPILLICHCYGGLVAQKAYLASYLHASDYPGIYDSITGILFLGTPHQGWEMSAIPAVGETYELIQQQRFRIEDGLLQTLAPGNPILVDTAADFTRHVKQRTAPPELFCFFERRPTDVGRILGLEGSTTMLLRSESSSALPGHEKRGLTLDHFNMNKFVSNEDNHYIAVVDELVRMGEKTKDIMRKRRESLSDDDLKEDSIWQSKQVLDWFRVNYGEWHEDTVKQIYNLALVQDKYGEHAEAEQLYLEAIKAMEELCGGGSLSSELLRIQGSLARMYGQQGRYADADVLLRSVLEGQTELLGFDHPESLVTRMNLALVAQALNPEEPAASEKELMDVLTVQVRLLGDQDPAALRTASNLAQSYRLGGRVDDAEELFRLSLKEQRKTLGERHPDTITTMTMLKELEDDKRRSS